MRVQTMDGSVFAASDAGGLVRALWAASRSKARKASHFRAQLALQVRSVTGQGVRSGNDADFVADLLARGFLKPVDAPDGAA